jgi:hypothetical protein
VFAKERSADVQPFERHHTIGLIVTPDGVVADHDNAVECAAANRSFQQTARDKTLTQDAADAINHPRALA